MKRERRDPKMGHMRDLIDGLRQAEATTDEAWLQAWIHSGMPWMSRGDWIGTLKEMIAAEAIRVCDKEAA